MDEFVRAAITENMDPEAALGIIEALQQERAVKDLLSPRLTTKVRRLAHAVGPNGSPALTQLTKDEVFAIWCSKSGIVKEQLTNADRQTLDFALSGIISIIPSILASENTEEQFESFLGTGVPTYLFNQIRTIAQRTQERAASKKQP